MCRGGVVGGEDLTETLLELVGQRRHRANGMPMPDRRWCGMVRRLQGRGSRSACAAGWLDWVLERQTMVSR